MKRFVIGVIVISVVVVAAALATGVTSDADDVEIVLSDMPLTAGM